jgi:HEPN domain-containing protein
MLELDPVLQIVRQWVQKAENDIKNAAFTLKLGRACPTDTVCFCPQGIFRHPQQCVEKYLKALLVVQEIDFARTHNISALLALLPERLRPDLSPEEQALLTDYAVSTRYPGDMSPFRCWKRGVTVVGGFHAPMERECLTILLRGAQPVILCPARNIGMRIRPEYK